MRIKTIIIVLAVCGLMVTSCTNANKSENDSASSQIESVEKTSDIEDLIEPCRSDSIEAVTRSGSSSEGFGRCSKCSCKAFEGRGDVCKNCGHAYKAHY